MAKFSRPGLGSQGLLALLCWETSVRLWQPLEPRLPCSGAAQLCRQWRTKK